MKKARSVVLNKSVYGLMALGKVAPSVAAVIAERLWFMPPRPRLGERAELAAGRRLVLDVEGRRSVAFAFGAGQPIALMHGWGGHAGQLAGFVSPLVDRGFQPILIEALGHGESEASQLGYRQASFFDFAAGLAALEKIVGPFRGLIAHSGGAVATVLALQAGLHAERIVLLAPMARPELYASMFSSALGLGPEVKARWQERASRRVGFQWSDLDATALPARMELPPTLVVHDLEDREVPFAEGRAIAEAWPGAELHSISNLGHRRLLRDEAVIRRSIDFVTERA